MDRINARIAQIYGYAVCLICVVVILVSTHGIIDAAFDYANPLGASGSYGRFGPMTSYEVYRIQARRQTTARAPDGRAVSDTSFSDAELRSLYNAERAEQQSAAKFRALRSLVSGIVFLILATAMFLLHWRWIRRTNAGPVVG